MDSVRDETGSPRRRAVLIAALLLTGLSMRTAATSVGAALDDLQHGLHVSGGVAGLITTLPVLCFAVFGSLTPRLSRRVDPQALLTGALTLTTVGLVLRPVTSDVTVFTLLSVLALLGGAVSNVLMPSLVKRYFPDRIGAMTALYTTALAVGSTAGAGLTVPIGDVSGGWRVGLGSWGVLTLLAVFPWLATLRGTRTERSAGTAGTAPQAPGPSAVAGLLRDRTAWALTIFFGAQSMQAYIGFGWFARFFVGHGVDNGTAGAMVALFSAMGIPVSAIAPRVPVARQRAALVGLCVCTLVAYLGMALAPVAGAWAWMVIAGIGSGTFPMVLTLIGQRAHTAAGTAALSAFAQSIGYVVAGTGPLLFGALFGATGHWAAPLAVLFVAGAITLVAAWPVTVVRFVDEPSEPAPVAAA